MTVAEVLPFLVDMVGDCVPAGTPGGKAAILNLLGDLCHQEETTVRDQAVASLNKIGATLSAKDVQALVVPIALLRFLVRAHDDDYVDGQLYLEPHPREMMLRNHV